MNNETQLENSYRVNKLIVIITCILMFASLFVPFSSTLSYIYQILVVGIIVFLGKGEIESIIPLLILSTTRSYISVSTNNEVVSYLGMNGIMISIALIGILLYYLWKHSMELQFTWMNVVLFIFALIMLLSCFFISNKTEYNDYYIPICLAYMIIPLLFSSEKAVFVSRIAFALAGAWMAVGIVPHLLTIGDIYQSAVQVDRNYQSCFLVICILQTMLLLVSGWKRQKIVSRFFLILIIVFDAYILLTSASRSAFIALLLGALLYCFINLGDYKKLFGFLIILGIAIYVANEFGLFDTILSRFTLADASSGNGRYELWGMYISEISDGNILSFLFGHGLVGQTELGRVAHNMFISIFYAYGFIGFILIVILVVFCTSTFLKNKCTNDIIVFLPIILECMSLEPYYRMEFALYFSLAVASAIFYRNKKHKKRVF